MSDFHSLASTALKDAWVFSQVPSEHLSDVERQWHPCSIPTSVHVELKKLGVIPDLYKDLNEWKVQWIQEADWTFKTEFNVDKSRLNSKHLDLLFAGLDTYCTITLNGHDIATVENMFVSHRIDVKNLVKESGNRLELHFKSPWHQARQAEESNGGPMPLWNGASNRLYSRKAQYGWGWDWGPVMMTVGPWKDIQLETYDARLEDIRIETTLTGENYRIASLQAKVTVSTDPDDRYHVDLALKDADGGVIRSTENHPAAQSLHWNLQDEVEAWFPRGYGNQTLYSLDVQLKDKHGTILDRQSKRVAFRSAKIIQEPLEGQDGTSFVFEINGIRIFCGGSNWIPADSFLTDIQPERYRAWVDLLVTGNQNMLRVWGGGVYEAEELYNACDERGILVWQDFMFGCGLQEAEQAVIRLRDHPSVVIFAGNNEDYALAESIGVMDYNDNSGDYMKSKFPARHIYEILLPEVVNRLSTIFYHRSSPYGGKDSGDKTVGDIHQWNVWHGTQEPWSNWDKLAGRFVSEFGMQGYPDRQTVDQWSDDKTQLFPQSRISVNHNKADGFERRLELYLMENFRHGFDMPSYIYYTQMIQAECLAAAYRLWRRNFKGRGKEYTSGALVWQINDCWPCVSWAIADYYLRPKPAFFTIARELEKYTVGIVRKSAKTFANKISSALFEIKEEIEIWGCNSTLQPVDATIELVTFNLETDHRDKHVFEVQLQSNASTEIWSGTVPGQAARTDDSQIAEPIIVQARLYLSNKKDTVVARASSWPEPYKYLRFPNPGLRITVDNEQVRISCKKPVKGLVLDVEGEECSWSDQALDLFPGDEQIVHAKGLNNRAVTYRYVGDHDI
ncbi:uncharacterized protein L201_000469 [Kwoniella dendrophila CBS 6074]|uniref:Beta-mannosidase B n=1 Tax=Kwoniella dendrophila CBS 6074 TaxID=1295534 RepID=A0AAX4JM41_9TREE